MCASVRTRMYVCVLRVLLLWAYNESYVDDVNMPSTLVRQGNIANVAAKELNGPFKC